MLFLQEFIKVVGLQGRLRLEWISSAEATKFVQVISEFTEQIRALGPSPLAKGYGQPLEDLEVALEPKAGNSPSCACGHGEAVAGAR